MHLLKYVLKIDAKKQVFLSFIVIISVVLGFYNISLEGKIIDEAIASGAKTGKIDLLIKYITVYLIVFLSARGLSYYSEVLFMKVSQKTLIHLRTSLFNHVLRLNIGFFHKTPTGEIMSRIIPEVQQLGSFMSQIILIPLNAAITIIAGISLVAGIEWRVGLVSFGIFSLVFFFLPKLRASLKNLTKKWSQKMRNISRQTEDSISHYMEIQSNNTFAFEEEKFKNSLLEFADISVDITKVHGKTTFVSQLFSGLATLSVYGFGGWLVIKETGLPGAFTVGSIFVMIRALATITGPVTSLIDFSQRYQEALVKFEMVSDYLSIPKGMVDKDEAVSVEKIAGKVDVSNLAFGFDSSGKIVKNVNLLIKPGEHVAFVGPAGSGKSTLALLINRLTEANEGELELDATDIISISLDSLRKNVGYVAQARTNTPVLFGGTLADNIIYSLRRRKNNNTGSPEGWLDLESVGIKNMDDLREKIIEVLKDVDFYNDVYNFGLGNVTLLDALKQEKSIFSIKNPDSIRREIMKGRRRFREKIRAEDRELIEFFDRKSYSEHLSIMENIIFTSADPFMKDLKIFEMIEPACREAGIFDEIFEIGCKTTIELSEILRRIKGDPVPFLRRMGIIHQLPANFIGIGEKMKIHGTDHSRENLPESEFREIMRIGYEYSPARGIDIYIDDNFRKKALNARKIISENLPDAMKGITAFYDGDNYVDGATIRENLIMGRVNSIVHGAEGKISSIIREVIEEVQLDDEIISLGLLMDIGERGSRLSGGQSQKTAIARALLKAPSVLILDEATSALDNASQQKISGMLSKKYCGKTVITIAHRLDTIKDYDRIVVLKAGEVIETGKWHELMDKKGLFQELWETSYGQGR